MNGSTHSFFLCVSSLKDDLTTTKTMPIIAGAEEVNLLQPSRGPGLNPNPWMVASAGETDRYLAWTQSAQKLGVYNII
jgi:hypothetical protein